MSGAAVPGGKTSVLSSCGQMSDQMKKNQQPNNAAGRLIQADSPCMPNTKS